MPSIFLRKLGEDYPDVFLAWNNIPDIYQAEIIDAFRSTSKGETELTGKQAINRTEPQIRPLLCVEVVHFFPVDQHHDAAVTRAESHYVNNGPLQPAIGILRNRVFSLDSRRGVNDCCAFSAGVHRRQQMIQ